MLHPSINVSKMLFYGKSNSLLELEHELQLSFQNSILLVLALGEEQATCAAETALRFYPHHTKRELSA